MPGSGAGLSGRDAAFGALQRQVDRLARRPPPLTFVDLWHRDRFVLTAAGAQVLSFTWEPKATPLFVFLNGIYQEEGADYTVLGSGLYVDADMGAEVGDVLEVRYLIAAEGTSVHPYSLAVLADSPALYWTLGDELGALTSGAAETVLDSSGNGRHGTTWIDGSITFEQTGLIAGAPDTAADINWARIKRDSEPWMSFGSFAMEGLIRSTDLGGSMLWTRNDYGTGQQSFLFGTEPGTGHLSFGRSPYSSWITGSVNVMDGNTHHYVANYDGTDLELRVDGVLDASAAMAALPVSSAPLLHGGLYTTGWGTDNYTDFTGRSQHPAVYTHALTPARIAAHVAAAGL